MIYEGVSRFLIPQNETYLRALAEIKNGKKVTHWMWYIFPQLKGLGSSETANYYAVKNINEAREYLHHPVLGKNLIEISEALLEIKSDSAHEIFGRPDAMKLHSSATLFSQVMGSDAVFAKVLDKYFNGIPDSRTIELLNPHY
jgi:uncharacterized protein (DUF1810 family)